MGLKHTPQTLNSYWKNDVHTKKNSNDQYILKKSWFGTSIHSLWVHVSFLCTLIYSLHMRLKTHVNLQNQKNNRKYFVLDYPHETSPVVYFISLSAVSLTTQYYGQIKSRIEFRR